MKKLLEKDVQKTILDYLRLKKYVAVKFNSSIFVGGKGQEGRFIKSPQVGVSDILACSPTGKFVAIEVKVKYNKPSPEQVAFLDEIRKRGGVAILAYSLDDVMKIVV